MPKRVALSAIGVSRDGKTVYPEIGKAFNFTSEELTDIAKLEKASGTLLVRKPVNEDPEGGTMAAPQGGDGTVNEGQIGEQGTLGASVNSGINGEGGKPEIQRPEYQDQTVAQLKDLAQRRSIDLGEATRKDDIIAVIVAADQDDEL